MVFPICNTTFCQLKMKNSSLEFASLTTKRRFDRVSHILKRKGREFFETKLDEVKKNIFFLFRLKRKTNEFFYSIILSVNDFLTSKERQKKKNFKTFPIKTQNDVFRQNRKRFSKLDRWRSKRNSRIEKKFFNTKTKFFFKCLTKTDF